MSAYKPPLLTTLQHSNSTTLSSSTTIEADPRSSGNLTLHHSPFPATQHRLTYQNWSRYFNCKCKLLKTNARIFSKTLFWVSENGEKTLFQNEKSKRLFLLLPEEGKDPSRTQNDDILLKKERKKEHLTARIYPNLNK